MTTTEGHVADRPVEVFRGPGDVLLFMTNVRGIERDKLLRRAGCPAERIAGRLYTRYVPGPLGHAARSRASAGWPAA